MPLFSATKWMDIATVILVTLKLGLLEFKMASVRVPLSITPVWADEQPSQPLQWCFFREGYAAAIWNEEIGLGINTLDC